MPRRRGSPNARAGLGPAFLLCDTYRYTGHHVGDVNREYYRPKQEELQWKTERDPIRNLARWLIAEKFSDQNSLDKLQPEIKAEVDAAVQFAVAAPYPGIDQVSQDVYAAD